MNSEDLARYKWYHRIPLPGGLVTPGVDTCQDSWDFILAGMRGYEFDKKQVLDVGCRDGLFSFEAEKMGGTVTALDNDIAPGSLYVAKEIGSRVSFVKANLYAMTYRRQFDIVLFFGVLYHLRYPVWGLRSVLSALKIGGTLLMETAVFIVPVPYEVIYCPVKNSPYDATSCSFFNESALRVTLASLGCVVVRFEKQPNSENDRVARYFVEVRKNSEMSTDFKAYWEGVHEYHSRANSDFNAQAVM